MVRFNLFNIVTRRIAFGIIFLFCLLSITYAYYAQFRYGVEPCPLCIAQRIIYGAIGVVSLVAFIHNTRRAGNWGYGIILIGISLLGIKTAYHHVWLQQLPPDQLPTSCGMPLSILYKKIPLSGFIHTILSGSAECALVNWNIFGIAAPLVSMYGYIVLALASLYVLICPKKI